MNLIISNVSIRQFNNLYNLNDFHRASGGENRHRPSFWLQNQQALDLINELNVSVGNPTVPVIKVINGGRNRGTYVCKELIYAYATWVSAPFFLKVIRTFDASISGSLKLEPVQPALPSDAVVLSKNDVHNLKALLSHLPYMQAYFFRTKSAVRSLNSDIVYKVYDRFNDASFFAGELETSLQLSIPSWRDAYFELD